MPHYDYDKDYPFAAFITNLGKYNEGALVGEWVKFPTTAEELKKVFERIGIGAKDDFGQTYEEWFITDYDCYVDGLYDLLGEYANLDELNYLASKLDDMSQDEYERFQAAMEIGDHTGSIQELINLTENLDCYDVYPDIHDHDDLGRYYIEELDAMVKGIYQAATSSRQTRTKPPITPPIIKFSRNNGRAVPKEPPGTIQANIRGMPKGRPQRMNSHT